MILQLLDTTELMSILPINSILKHSPKLGNSSQNLYICIYIFFLFD